MKMSLFLCALVFIACTPNDVDHLNGEANGVIDGFATPEEAGFELNRLEAGAVGGQRVVYADTLYQGCSGTLVGDRLAVVAAHCVVSNQQEWIQGTEDAQISSLSAWGLGTGDDMNDPDCLFTAESIHIHPDVVDASDGIDQDMALVVLNESVLETCPGSVPLQLNREAPTQDMMGELFLQGGFGSVDGTYDFSPIRFWSAIELGGISGSALAFADTEMGFPTFGDSGSGALKRYDDGSLRVGGIASRGGGGSMLFTRVDAFGDFIDSIVTDENLCGPVGEKGKCLDEFYLSCDDSGFMSIDCTEEDCPLACPCECDTSFACEEGCECDGDCQEEDPPANSPGETDDSSGGGGGCSTTLTSTSTSLLSMLSDLV